ncbi:MAG: hypothetical protein HQL18_02600, partial [Candidatus Omnitrophica bacterium]|nr:hypothetical protein [Candidatus Omnitrophota bacterium]
AFKKGAYNYIKEEKDPFSDELIPRKYFSGGVDCSQFTGLVLTMTDNAGEVEGDSSNDSLIQVGLESDGKQLGSFSGSGSQGSLQSDFAATTVGREGFYGKLHVNDDIWVSPKGYKFVAEANARLEILSALQEFLSSPERVSDELYQLYGKRIMPEDVQAVNVRYQVSGGEKHVFRVEFVLAESAVLTRGLPPTMEIAEEAYKQARSTEGIDLGLEASRFKKLMESEAGRKLVPRLLHYGRNAFLQEWIKGQTMLAARKGIPLSASELQNIVEAWTQVGDLLSDEGTFNHYPPDMNAGNIMFREEGAVRPEKGNLVIVDLGGKNATSPAGFIQQLIKYFVKGNHMFSIAAANTEDYDPIFRGIRNVLGDQKGFDFFIDALRDFKGEMDSTTLARLKSYLESDFPERVSADYQPESLRGPPLLYVIARVLYYADNYADLDSRSLYELTRNNEIFSKTRLSGMKALLAAKREMETRKGKKKAQPSPSLGLGLIMAEINRLREQNKGRGGQPFSDAAQAAQLTAQTVLGAGLQMAVEGAFTLWRSARALVKQQGFWAYCAENNANLFIFGPGILFFNMAADAGTALGGLATINQIFDPDISTATRARKSAELVFKYGVATAIFGSPTVFLAIDLAKWAAGIDTLGALTGQADAAQTAVAAEKALLESVAARVDTNGLKTFRVPLKDGSFAVGKVDVWHPRAWGAEVAAYRLSVLLGLGSVPVTAHKKFPNIQGEMQDGVLQMFVPGEEGYEKRSADDFRKDLSTEGMKDLQVFWYLIGDFDKGLVGSQGGRVSPQNFWIRSDGQPVSVDHGLAFQQDDHFFWNIIPSDALRARLAALTEDTIRAALSDEQGIVLIDDYSFQWLLIRLKTILKTSDTAEKTEAVQTAGAVAPEALADSWAAQVGDGQNPNSWNSDTLEALSEQDPEYGKYIDPRRFDDFDGPNWSRAFSKSNKFYVFRIKDNKGEEHNLHVIFDFVGINSGVKIPIQNKTEYDSEVWQQTAEIMARASVEARNYAPWVEDHEGSPFVTGARIAMNSAANGGLGLNVGFDAHVKPLMEAIRNNDVDAVEKEKKHITASMVHEKTHEDRDEIMGSNSAGLETASHINQYLFDPKGNVIFNKQLRTALKNYFENVGKETKDPKFDPVYDVGMYRALLIVGFFLSLINPEYRKVFMEGNPQGFQPALEALIGRPMDAKEADFMKKVVVPVLSRKDSVALEDVVLAIQNDPQGLLEMFLQKGIGQKADAAQADPLLKYVHAGMGSILPRYLRERGFDQKGCELLVDRYLASRGQVRDPEVEIKFLGTGANMLVIAYGDQAIRISMRTTPEEGPHQSWANEYPFVPHVIDRGKVTIGEFTFDAARVERVFPDAVTADELLSLMKDLLSHLVKERIVSDDFGKDNVRIGHVMRDGTQSKPMAFLVDIGASVIQKGETDQEMVAHYRDRLTGFWGLDEAALLQHLSGLAGEASAPRGAGRERAADGNGQNADLAGVTTDNGQKVDTAGVRGTAGERKSPVIPQGWTYLAHGTNLTRRQWDGHEDDLSKDRWTIGIGGLSTVTREEGSNTTKTYANASVRPNLTKEEYNRRNKMVSIRVIFPENYANYPEKKAQFLPLIESSQQESVMGMIAKWYRGNGHNPVVPHGTSLIKIGQTKEDGFDVFYYIPEQLQFLYNKTLGLRFDNFKDIAGETPQARAANVVAQFERDSLIAGLLETPDEMRVGTLKNHTLAVLTQFESRFSDQFNEEQLAFLRVLLVLHDIGKDNPTGGLNQHRATLDVINKLKEKNSQFLDKYQWKLLELMLNGDSIGRYMQSGAKFWLEKIVKELKGKVDELDGLEKGRITLALFFKFMKVYYQVDTSGRDIDKNGRITGFTNLYGKEPTYESGRFRFSEVKLSDGTSFEDRFQALERAVEAISDMAEKGGIDFNSDRMNLEARGDGGAGIKFHIDAAQLQKLQNSSGFTPVIMNIEPMADVAQFLGIKK